MVHQLNHVRVQLQIMHKSKLGCVRIFCACVVESRISVMVGREGGCFYYLLFLCFAKLVLVIEKLVSDNVKVGRPCLEN